jgi:hypothetical protein
MRLRYPIVGRRTDAAPPSWIIIATAEMDVNADPPPERAAMVRAGRVERGIALARCCDWPVLWQRQPGLAVQPDPVRTVARCDNHNGARCDWRRLFRAGAVHSSRHPPVTARQHGRWMPRRQGSAASLRIIRGVPLRLRPPVRPKGRADPG